MRIASEARISVEIGETKRHVTALSTNDGPTLTTRVNCKEIESNFITPFNGACFQSLVTEKVSTAPSGLMMATTLLSCLG
jgi:hypothetical protein